LQAGKFHLPPSSARLPAEFQTQIEYAQKKGRATPITTHSATVTLTSTTIQASQLTKISPAAKAEINKAKKANDA
jgi:hypothetical protein